MQGCDHVLHYGYVQGCGHVLEYGYVQGCVAMWREEVLGVEELYRRMEVHGGKGETYENQDVCVWHGHVCVWHACVCVHKLKSATRMVGVSMRAG